MKQHYYRHIKDLTRFVGLSDNGLRLYEREGIIHPRHNEQSGYREVSMEDGKLLSAGMTLSKCGFSIRETADMLNRKTLGQQADLLEQRSRKMNDELLFRMYANRYLDELVSLMRRYESNPAACRILPGRLLYFLPVHDENMINREGSEDSAQWARQKPFSTGAVFLTKERLLTGRGGELNGPSMWDEQVRYTGVPICNAFLLGKSMHYVQGFVLSDNANPLTSDSYAHVLEYLEKKKLEVCGDSFARTLTCERYGDGWHCLYELWIPVSGGAAEH